MLPILFLTQRGQWIIWKPEEAQGLLSCYMNGGMQRGNGSLEVKFHGIRSQRRPTALPDELRTILENVIIAYCSKRSN